MKKDYFVPIQDTQGTHINLLTIAKRLLETSKSYYALTKLYEKKKVLFTRLQEELDELVVQFEQLEESLPYQELLSSKEESTSQKKKESSSKKPVDKTSLLEHEQKLAKLQEALNLIEKKLGKLVL